MQGHCFVAGHPQAAINSRATSFADVCAACIHDYVAGMLPSACAGDVGAKFSWSTKQLSPHFSLAPTAGFLAPGQSAAITVTLAPRAAASELRADGVACSVAGLKEPLLLTLTGAAAGEASIAGTVQFACAARGLAEQAISIANPTPQEWQLRPVVQNAAWSGAEFFVVPANSKADYRVQYRPLSMADEARPHEGSVFFPLPDGSGQTYKLRGTAGAPAPAGTRTGCVDAVALVITACFQHSWSV